MKWQAKEEPKSGDRRIRMSFLLFPKTIEGETRWLVFAKWEEIYTKYIRSAFSHYFQWETLRWHT